MTSPRDIEILSRFARIIAADGYSHGLQPVQWQALQFLARANRFSRTPKGLTTWLGQTKGSVSQTILALEGKGLVSRAPDDDDRRVVRVELTGAGRTLLEDPPAAMASQMLGFLPQAERDRVVGAVEAMLRAHLAANGQQAFGQCRSCRHFSSPSVGNHYCALLDLLLTDHDAELICIEQVAA